MHSRPLNDPIFSPNRLRDGQSIDENDELDLEYLRRLCQYDSASHPVSSNDPIRSRERFSHGNFNDIRHEHCQKQGNPSKIRTYTSSETDTSDDRVKYSRRKFLHGRLKLSTKWSGPDSSSPQSKSVVSSTIYTPKNLRASQLDNISESDPDARVTTTPSSRITKVRKIGHKRSQSGSDIPKSQSSNVYSSDLDTWKRQVQEMSNRNIPLFPPHSSPSNLETARSAPVSPGNVKYIQGAGWRSKEQLGDTPATQHWLLKKGDVGSLSRQLSNLEDQTWSTQIKAGDHNNVSRNAPLRAVPLRSPLHESNLEAPKPIHHRQNTLQLWKSELEKLRVNPEYELDIPDEFDGIEDQRWTKKITKMDTLQRFKKKTVQSFTSAEKYGTAIIGIDEDETVFDSKVASIVRRAQSLELGGRHKRQTTLDQWKVQLQNETLSMHDQTLPQNAESFDDISDQRWTKTVTRQDTMKRMRHRREIPPNLFPPVTPVSGRNVKEAPTEEAASEEFSFSEVNVSTQLCVRDLLRSISELYTRGSINERTKANLKELILLQYPDLMDAARILHGKEKGKEQLQQFVAVFAQNE